MISSMLRPLEQKKKVNLTLKNWNVYLNNLRIIKFCDAKKIGFVFSVKNWISPIVFWVHIIYEIISNFLCKCVWNTCQGEHERILEKKNVNP
jgi:hypothetical protein